MNRLKVDVAIIGAGSAGMTAYRAARQHTDSVVVIDSGRYGTTCARVGCMPSKLLISAADAAHGAALAPSFGVETGAVKIDGRKVMERVRSERDRFVEFVVDAVESWPDEHRLRGSARFISSHELMVGEETVVQADRIVIATGSSPSIPSGWRETLGDRLIVNDDIFDWEDLPESVAVVGSGVIGLELAQALHRLGVRVRVYGRDETIGPLTDPAVEREATRIFSEEIPTSLSVRVTPSLATDGRVSVMTEDAQGARSLEAFDYLLVAAGRRPNLDRLGLASAGIERDETGMPTIYRATMQSSRSHIFIAGDANGFRPLLHEAADDGRIAGDNAGRYPIVRARPRRASLGIVFSDPQIAMAGASHRDLLSTGVAFEVAEASFADQGRSRVMLQNRGMIRVYADVATGTFLGAEMVGPAAEHIGHLLAWSAQRGDTVQQMIDSPFYHPVVEEGVRTALRDLQRKLSIAPPTPESCLDCIAGA
ncbi:dihydrolipoyl dehydrogenase [Stenotrophomonas maltophilia]|uniref:dihydrolipoyl dehydrogenase n=1 Tax=Stenotrophomonas sp. TaxID=69392 RepID=UPI002FCC89AC